MSSDGSAASSLRVPGGHRPGVPGLPEDALLRGDPGEQPAPEPAGEQTGALARAAALRFPDLSDKHGRDRIDALCDHIAESAIIRGELEELRLSAHVNLRDAQRELAAVPTGVTRSRAAIDETKRQARPDLAARVDGARWLVDRCSEQINRMGGSEYDAASRAYTLLSAHNY